MKRSFWFGLGAALLAAPATAQSLTGVWQGVETDTGQESDYWPSVLRIQQSKGTAVFGVLYEEVGSNPGISVTFRMEGTRSATGMQLDHVDKLNETGRTLTSSWCVGAITFTYDAAQEKLTGRATYRPAGTCDVGTFTLYRIRLKSAATVPAGVASILRVSGRNVRWFADAGCRQPVATGNTHRAALRKTTTFYLKQSYYPTDQSPVVPITIQVSGTPRKAAPKAPAAVVPPAPYPPKVDSAAAAPAPILPPQAAPVVLPTVLFEVGKPALLPSAAPVLNQLATELNARPGLKLRIAGHADKVGEPEKNQVLSEQRAEAVKAYLVNAGIDGGRISALGLGDSHPLYPSPDARNRRVEVEEVK